MLVFYVLFSCCMETISHSQPQRVVQLVEPVLFNYSLFSPSDKVVQHQYLLNMRFIARVPSLTYRRGNLSRKTKVKRLSIATTIKVTV